MEIQMGGGGGGGLYTWKSWGEGGSSTFGNPGGRGGQKTYAFRRGGVDFSGITHCLKYSEKCIPSIQENFLASLAFILFTCKKMAFHLKQDFSWALSFPHPTLSMVDRVFFRFSLWIDWLRTKELQFRGPYLKLGQKRWYTSNQLFENQCNKICSYLSEKASKGRFLKHEKLQNHSNEEKRKQKKKEQGEGKEKKKSNGCTLGFYNSYFGDRFWPKKTYSRFSPTWLFCMTTVATRHVGAQPSVNKHHEVYCSS